MSASGGDAGRVASARRRGVTDVERQAAIGKDTAQLQLLIKGVAERFGGQVATVLCEPRLLRPLEEVIHERPHVLVTRELALSGRQLPEGIVCRVDGANAEQALQADLVLADSSFEEIAAAVSDIQSSG